MKKLAMVMAIVFCACDDVGPSLDDMVAQDSVSADTSVVTPSGDGRDAGVASPAGDSDTPSAVGGNTSQIPNDAIDAEGGAQDTVDVDNPAADGDMADASEGDTPLTDNDSMTDGTASDGGGDAAVDTDSTDADLPGDVSNNATETGSTDVATDSTETDTDAALDSERPDTALEAAETSEETSEIEEMDTSVDMDLTLDTDSPADTAVDATEGTDTTGDVDTDPCVPTLLINEIDYDVPGKDIAEFVELYNPTDCDMPVDGLVLVLVNGSDMEEYRRVALSDAGVDVVAAESYLLIHGEALAVSADIPAVVMTQASGFIQNGPDGIALFDETAQIVIDAFCYEVPMTEVWFDDIDVSFNLVEGEMNPELVDTASEGVSISRIPNGANTQNSAVDWAVSISTPGAANQVE